MEPFLRNLPGLTCIEGRSCEFSRFTMLPARKGNFRGTNASHLEPSIQSSISTRPTPPGMPKTERAPLHRLAAAATPLGRAPTGGARPSLRPRTDVKHHELETFQWGVDDSDELDTSPPRQRPRSSLQTRDDLHGTPFNNCARSWNPEEDTRLRNAIDDVGCKWMAVAQLVGGGRSPAMCRNRFQRMQAPIHGKRAVNLCSACGQPKRGHTCIAKLDAKLQRHPPLPFAAAPPGGAPDDVVDTLRPRALHGDQLRAPLRDLPVPRLPSSSLSVPRRPSPSLSVPRRPSPSLGLPATLEVPDMAPEVGVDASYVDEFDAMTEYDDEPHMTLDECPASGGASGGSGSGGGGGGTGAMSGTGTAGWSAFERHLGRPGSATGAISGGTSLPTSESSQLGGMMLEHHEAAISESSQLGGMLLEHHEAAYSSAYWTLAALGMALGSPATTPEPTPQPLVPSSSFDVSTALGTALDGVKTLDTARVPSSSFVAEELFPTESSSRSSVRTEPSDVAKTLDTALDGVKTLDTALDGVKTLGGAIVSVIAELDFTPASHFVSELLGLERHTELE